MTLKKLPLLYTILSCPITANITPPPHQKINHQQRHLNTTHNPCDLSCKNGGYCIRLNEIEMLNTNENNSLPPEMCHCPDPSSRGILCDMKSDCTDAYEVSQLAGEMCERPKTEYCGNGVENGVEEAMMKNAFCTNGGSCRDYIKPGDLHVGCDCPDEFGGEYCEYFLAFLEEESQTSLSTSEADSSSIYSNPYSTYNEQYDPLLSFLFYTIIIMAAIITIGYLFTCGKNAWKRKRDRDILRATADLELEPDGSFFYDSDDQRVPEQQGSRHSVASGGIEMKQKAEGESEDEASLATATTTGSDLMKGKKGKDYSLVNIEFA